MAIREHAHARGADAFMMSAALHAERSARRQLGG